MACQRGVKKFFWLFCMCELQRGDKLLKEIKAGVEAQVLCSSDSGSLDYKLLVLLEIKSLVPLNPGVLQR